MNDSYYGKEYSNESGTLLPTSYQITSPGDTFDWNLNQALDFEKDLQNWWEIMDNKDPVPIVSQSTRWCTESDKIIRFNGR